VPANASGNILGQAFVDANANGRRDGGEPVLAGARVRLTGKTLQNVNVNVTATALGNGRYNFKYVQPGTYRLHGDGFSAVLGGKASADTASFFVRPGQAARRDLAFRGIGPQGASVRQFLSSTNNANPPAGNANVGTGTALASSRPNNRPFLMDAIDPVTADVNDDDTIIDLAGHFSDPDFTNSRVQFVTSLGNIKLELFDKLAPRTVANFLSYVTSDRYDNTIFHRLGRFLHSAGPRDVLQGGLFELGSTNGQTTLTEIDVGPEILDEVGRPNVKGTISMAKRGPNPLDPTDTGANSATSQFFFNLVDNVKPLSPEEQENGGFTVFGRIDPKSMSVLKELADFQVQDKSSFNPALDDLPLSAPAITPFPGGTNESQYAVVEDVRVLRRTERLRYKVVSNSNPGLVTAKIEAHRLVLDYAANKTGTARITVRATDKFGATTQTSFNVTVS
jgi:cyclophilin family peptidyl-prolyl cis-trans isomerase